MLPTPCYRLRGAARPRVGTPPPCAIRPLPIPVLAPYDVPMQSQPIGAGQSHTSAASESGETAAGARKKPRNLSPSGRKHRFLREFERVGTLSAGRRAAGVSYLDILEWFDDDIFRQRFREAKLAFGDRLEELLMERILEKQDGPTLRLKVRGELVSKYNPGLEPDTDEARSAMKELQRGIFGEDGSL